MFDEAGLLLGDVVGRRPADNANRLALLVGALRVGVALIFIEANLSAASAHEIVQLAEAKVAIADKADDAGNSFLSANGSSGFKKSSLKFGAHPI